MTGYEALRESAAWLDVSARGRLRVTGEDRARLLHAMTTNHVQQMKPGDVIYAFFLSAQGRILADANLLCFEDHFLLDTEPETAEKLREHLDRFIIADDATVEDVSAETVAIAVEGPRAVEAVEGAGAPVKAEISYTGQPGRLLIAPVAEREKLIASVEAAGAIAATADDFRLVRIENGIPRYGDDISERYLAQETGQLRAIHFSKGCYLGQEIVERVRSRAQIHRVLMRLDIEGTEPPAPGTKLQAGGRDVAEVTSAVYSPTEKHVAALAYVRSEFAKPGTLLDHAVVR